MTNPRRALQLSAAAAALMLASAAPASAASWSAEPVAVVVPLQLGFDPDADEYVNFTRCTGHGVTGGNLGDIDPDTYFTGAVFLRLLVGESASTDGTTVSCVVGYVQREEVCSDKGCEPGPWTTREEPLELGPYFVDLTGPILTVQADRLGSAEGWYDGPVTFSVTGADALSGLASCSEPFTAAEETTGLQSVALECTDVAGNRSTRSIPYGIDLTAPTLAPTVSPERIRPRAEAFADPGAADAGSGVAQADCNGGAPLDTSTVGVHTVSCTATDRAGNTATTTVDYVVATDRVPPHARP